MNKLTIEKRTFCGSELSILLGHPEHEVLFFFKEAMLTAGLKITAVNRYAQKLGANALKFNEMHARALNMNALNKYQKTAWLVTEAGLYETLNRGWAVQTKPFRDWVNSEVLPTIRKTGAYDLQASNTPEAKAIGMDFEGLNAVLEAFKVQLRAEFTSSPKAQSAPLDDVSLVHPQALQ